MRSLKTSRRSTSSWKHARRSAPTTKKNAVALGPIQGSVKGLFLESKEPVFDVSADQAPDADFSGKGKRKNESKGIVQMLTMIIEDLDDEIKNGMKAEEGAQLEYEELHKAASKYQSELEAKEVNLEESIARRGQDKSDEEQTKMNNEADLKDEQDYKAHIKPDCDWIIGAFTKRADKRTAEHNGLVQAKEFLAGYQPALLEQKSTKPAFDDAAFSQIHFLGLSAH